MSKPSYATYVKDRLNGFGGTGNSFVFQDLVDFPEMPSGCSANPAARRARRRPATGRSRSATGLAEGRCRNPQRLGRRRPSRPACSRARPRRRDLAVLPERLLRDHQDYLFAIAEAMRFEYETIAAAGLTLQLDCPDLAMGRHVQFADLCLAEFRDRMRLHIEALNHAVRNIPAERSACICAGATIPGRTTATCPSPTSSTCWPGQAPGHPVRGGQSAPRPRVADVRDHQAAGGQVLVPGVIECQSNYIEHPELVAQRIGRYAHLVGRENVMAGVDCGFSIHVGQGGVDPTWSGPSWRPWPKAHASPPDASGDDPPRRTPTKPRRKRHDDPDRAAEPPAPQRLCHPRHGGDAAFLRGHYRSAAGRDLVRGRRAVRRAADLLPLFLRHRRRRRAGLLPVRRRGPGPVRPQMPASPFHHIALNVDAETQAAIEGRIEAAGFKEPQT